MTKNSFLVRAAALLLAAVLVVSVFAGCADAESRSSETSQESEMPIDDVEPVDDTAVAFRPAESGLPAMDTYEFPYLGMSFAITEKLQAQLENYDALFWTDEGFGEGHALEYALLGLYKLTEEQKNETFTAFDPDAWLAGLEKIGVLGVYHKDALEDLDTLTGCTEHKELGKSPDESYVYYMSFADGADKDLRSEFDKTVVGITEMTPLDPGTSLTAFAEGRIETANVGDFKTTDIGGTEYGKDVFGEYDLTLVNIFATWCSPCVQELPELQKLKENMAEKGVGVVGIVYDTVDPFSGMVDENALESAKLLQEKLGLTFPILMPEETELNGRLQGITGFPESFFVDRDGNIVGETYQGARSLEQWTKIVENELAKLKGEA